MGILGRRGISGSGAYLGGSGIYTPSAPAGDPVVVGGLLFDYPNSNGAYSLRQLKIYSPSFFEQKVVRVSRTNGTLPAERDFTSTEITNGTLLDFTGRTTMDSGLVTRIYDQDGSNHLFQNTVGNQGTIVYAGALIQQEDTQGGFKPAISMRVNTYYNFTNLTTPYTTFSLLKTESNNLNYLIWNGTADDAGLYLNGNFVNNKVGVYDGTSKEALLAGVGRQLTYYNYTGTTPSGNYEISQNDGNETSLNAGKVVNGDELGRSFSPQTLSINSIFQELVFYPTDNSANKTGIQNNLDSYYSIFGSFYWGLINENTVLTKTIIENGTPLELLSTMQFTPNQLESNEVWFASTNNYTTWAVNNDSLNTSTLLQADGLFEYELIDVYKTYRQKYLSSMDAFQLTISQ